VLYPYLGSQKASSSTKDSHQPKEVRKRPTGRAQGLSANRSCSKTRCEDINFMHCTENSKQIFLEMKLRGVIPNVHIHVSVSD
jgi:hypothetical protein